MVSVDINVNEFDRVDIWCGLGFYFWFVFWVIVLINFVVVLDVMFFFVVLLVCFDFFFISRNDVNIGLI